MIFYFGLLLLEAFFYLQFNYSYDKHLKFLSYPLAFIVLYFVLAFRYGIGTDYSHYEHAFQAIKIGYKMYQTEPIFYLYNKLCIPFGFTFMVAGIAFFTLIFFIKSINQECIKVEFPMFFLLFYIPSFTLMRQVLALIIFIYGYKKKECKIVYFIIASLIHKSIWILVIIYLFSKIIYFSWKFAVLVIIFIFVLFVLTSIGNNAIDLVISYTPFAGYLNTSHMGIKRHFGILSILQLLYEIFYFIFCYNTKKTKNNSFINLLFCCLLSSELIGIKILIFSTRLTFLFYPVFLFNADKSSNKQKIFQYFSLFIMLVVFCGRLLNSGHWDNVIPYSSILLR